MTVILDYENSPVAMLADAIVEFQQKTFRQSYVIVLNVKTYRELFGPYHRIGLKSLEAIADSDIDGYLMGGQGRIDNRMADGEALVMSSDEYIRDVELDRVI